MVDRGAGDLALWIPAVDDLVDARSTTKFRMHNQSLCCVACAAPRPKQRAAQSRTARCPIQVPNRTRSEGDYAWGPESPDPRYFGRIPGTVVGSEGERSVRPVTPVNEATSRP